MVEHRGRQTSAAILAAVVLGQALMSFRSPERYWENGRRGGDSDLPPTPFPLAEGLAAVELGRLREAGEGEVRGMLASVHERNGPRRAVADQGPPYLVAFIGTGLGDAGRRELVEDAFYLEMPDSFWDLDPVSRRAEVHAILEDPNEAPGLKPDENGTVRSRPDPDPAQYATLPFEVDEELVERWAKHMGLPDPGDGKAS